MTVLDEKRVLDDTRVLDDGSELKLGEAGTVAEAAVIAPPAPDRQAPEGDEDGVATEVSPWLASGASFLSTAAAGWMVAGVFTGSFARFVALTAALLGAGMVALSYRTRTPVLLQFVVLPLSVVVGAILVAPDATGGTANLPSLVVEALRSGGLAAPPVAFDPGWRFLLVVLVSAVAVTAATAAMVTRRPRLAVFIPAPMTVGGILIQPPGAEIVSVIVALVLTIGALALAYGADLAAQGTTGGEFEVRRLGKAIGILAALVAGLVLLSQLGLFFPDETESKAFPPKRPSPPPPATDRVIFTVKSELNAPWRTGVLDVYRDSAWMTPPLDSGRLVDLLPGGRVPDVAQPPADAKASATFEVLDLEGHNVPSIAEPRLVTNAPRGLRYDPRTQQLQTAGRARGGTRYTVEAPAPPDAGQLTRAKSPPKEIQEEFGDVPEAPPEIMALLGEMPDDLPLYERMQFVRTRFYDKVVAAGPGTPVDVPPQRVVAVLQGADASPYEITASEVLLVRWAGVPARIGYGYYGGEKKDDIVEIRPKHGAMWLEAYFEGSGWVAIVGRPPRAKSSLSQTDKIEDPLVRPTEELAATVYVPIRLQNVTLLSVLVQYWLKKVLPVLAGLAVVATFYVGLLKMARRFRRRLWASNLGPRERVAAAYTEWRDYAIDLNLGHPTLSPIEFLQVTVPDPDHAELAWLVTRVLWGDLVRDCRSEDAAQCELWARSLKKRLAAAQSPLTKVIAFASRASLKDPYTKEIPNLWWPWSPRQRVVAFLRSGLRRLGGFYKQARRARLRRAARRSAPAGATAWLFLLGCASLVLGGCVQDVDLKVRPAAEAVAPLPEVPTELGKYRFEADPKGEQAFEFYYDASLAAAGRLYAVRDTTGIVQATLQTTVLKPALRERARKVRSGILRGIGGDRFKLVRLGGERVYSMRMPEQRFLLAFSPDGESYQLLVATRDFTDADQLFIDLLSKQRGKEAVVLAQTGGAAPPDPRRGLP